MSLETLKDEIAALPLAARRHLAGYLVMLNMSEEEKTALYRKMDDDDPARWLTLEQVRERLEKIPPPPEDE